jgi:hypothetical protein
MAGQDEEEPAMSPDSEAPSGLRATAALVRPHIHRFVSQYVAQPGPISAPRGPSTTQHIRRSLRKRAFRTPES